MSAGKPAARLHTCNGVVWGWKWTTAEVFQAGYAPFLAGLRGRYPDAHIFCVNINGWPTSATS